MELLLFILVSIGVIVVPGPNVLVVISTSISYGRARGLQTVAGTSTAMIIQLLIAGFGTSMFVSSLSKGFLFLKWLGAAYLIYLGLSQIIKALNGDCEPHQITAVGSFQRGFWVSLTNPKTILFFSAFLPQFISSSSPYMYQIILLSTIFLFLAVMLDSAYAILASKLSPLLSPTRNARYQNGIVGSLYVAAGSLLAGSKSA